MFSPRVRVVAGTAVIALVAVGITVTQTDDGPNEPVRRTVEQPDPGLAQERATFAAQVGDLRRSLHIPAAQAITPMSDLRTLVAASVTGDGRDTDELLDAVDERVERVHEAADAIDEGVAQSTPTRPAVLPASSTDPVLTRVTSLDEQAPEVADRLRAAADRARPTAAAAARLRDATASYVRATEDLPDTSDADALREVWEDEREQLTSYLEAADAAAEQPALSDYAAAHREVAGSLRELADEALAELEDDDLDAYNLTAAEHQRALEGRIDDLAETVAPTAEAAVERLEEAADHTRGLVAELERLREQVDLGDGDDV